jgi:hypothetical protein
MGSTARHGTAHLRPWMPEGACPPTRACPPPPTPPDPNPEAATAPLPPPRIMARRSCVGQWWWWVRVEPHQLQPWIRVQSPPTTTHLCNCFCSGCSWIPQAPCLEARLAVLLAPLLPEYGANGSAIVSGRRPVVVVAGRAGLPHGVKKPSTSAPSRSSTAVASSGPLLVLGGCIPTPGGVGVRTRVSHKGRARLVALHYPTP